MSTNYPPPPWQAHEINRNATEPEDPTYGRRHRDDETKRRIDYDHGNAPSGAVSYQAYYSLPISMISGCFFNSIKESKNNCLKLEDETFNITATDNLDRLYYGTVNGDIIMVPFNSTLAPSKVSLKPVRIKLFEYNEEDEIYEIHGIKLDYAGRVWTTNAAGLFVFDQSLKQMLFYMPDERPGGERVDNYMEDIRRLQTDYNKRYIYWLLAGCIIRVIDTFNCSIVGSDYQFNRKSNLMVKQWKISPDGQIMFLLLEDIKTNQDRFEVHSIPNKTILQNFHVDLKPSEFRGNTRYYSFAVDFNKGKLVIVGISPDIELTVEEDEYGDEIVYEEGSRKERDLILRTYQLTSSGMSLQKVQQINQLEKKFYPYMINDCQFADFEEENHSGAGTLFLSVLGGLKKQKNFLFLVKWNPQSNEWFKHLVIQSHHRDQQLSWELKRNLLITTAADSTLSINSFN